MTSTTTTPAPAPAPTSALPVRGTRGFGVLSHANGLWAVAFAFLTVMGYCAVPTPLYGLYAARDGFGSLTITVVFASYGVGVLLSLFTVGHLSDHYGRRRILVPALLTCLASVFVFLFWRELPGLIVGRFISGLGIGAVTATATAWIAELHALDRPGQSNRRAEIVGVVANIGGIGLGPLVAGALAEWVTSPLTVPYLVYGGLLVLAIVALLLTPETRSVAASERPAYRVQQMHIPDERAPFVGALATAAVAFAAFGLFTSLAPSFLAGSLHTPSLALAGVAAFTVFGGSAASQVLLARRDNRELVLTGTAGLTLGFAAVVLAVWLSAPSLALFLAGGVVLGIGAGALFKGAVMTVLRLAEPARRAETLVGLFLVAYLGIMVPVVGLGVLTQHMAPRLALLIFGGVLVSGVLASLRPLLRAAAV